MKVGIALACGVLVLLLLPQAAVASNAACNISVLLKPNPVYFPSSVLPPSGHLTFSEILDVNYSASFTNQTMSVQALNGSKWTEISEFKGNGIGFTEVDESITSGWASFGNNSLRVSSGTCISDVGVMSIQPDPGAVWADVSAYLLVIGLLSLFFAAGRKLGWGRFLFVGAAVYLALAPFTGQRYDVYFLLSSGIRVLQHVNPFDPGNPPLYPGPLKWAYPPLYAAYSAIAFSLFHLFTAAPLPSVSALTWPGWFTSVYNVYEAYVPVSLPLLVFLLKVPMIASALATGFLIKRISGRESDAILWLANPLVILVAAVWGQLDPIATLLAVAALYYFQAGKLYHSYLMASFGAAVKVWPALIIPFMLVISLRKTGAKALKPLVAVVPALGATVLFYGAYGNLFQTLFVFAYARGIPTFSGAFSVNGLTWQQVLFVVNSPPVPLFLVLGIPLYLVSLGWVYWKKDYDIVKWLVVSILLFFLTYNYVNPQYFYWLVPLFLIQGRKRLAGLFTVLPLLFILFAYDIFYFVSPVILPSEYALGPGIADQLKVSFFYGTPWVFLLVSALVPTVAYLFAVYVQLRPRGPGALERFLARLAGG